MDRTHGRALRSLVEVAPGSHFPIQNLPFGVFRPRAGGRPRPGVRIGEHVLDLGELGRAGLLSSCRHVPAGTFEAEQLNPFLALGRPAWRETRAIVSDLLRAGNPLLRRGDNLRDRLLRPVAEVDMLLPAAIGDYTDFYSSKQHATNVGTMLRGAANALMPNWVHLPVAYHGRASSIVTSGTPVRRPLGQTRAEGASAPCFGPSRQLDFELEVGFLVGPGSQLGQPVPVDEALEHVFGLVLVNDWSARDIQSWEYQPLGPFGSKNFATTISPWVVTLEALEPFQCDPPAQDPQPLPYLRAQTDATYDIRLEVRLQPAGAGESAPLSRTNFKHLYWSVRQQLAHHTITGCNLRTGDLMASGTISAGEPSGFGSLLELTWRGSRPIVLPDGSTRAFLQDGDRVTFEGWCEAEGHRVGFGECSGVVLPALEGRA